MLVHKNFEYMSVIYRANCNLSVTLGCGQSFRWKEIPPLSGEWLGVINNNIVKLRLSSNSTQTGSYTDPHIS